MQLYKLFSRPRPPHTRARIISGPFFFARSPAPCGVLANSAVDGGKAALNQFLQHYALVNQKANSVQTYVCCQGDMVVGFYSLAVGSVDPIAAPSRVMKGLARHPVPVMILARLAVDEEHQRKGLGQALLKDALCALHRHVELRRCLHLKVRLAPAAHPTAIGSGLLPGIGTAIGAALAVSWLAHKRKSDTNDAQYGE